MAFEVGHDQRRSSNDLEINFDVDTIKKDLSPWRRFKYQALGWRFTDSIYFSTICGLCLAQPNNEKDLRLFRNNGYLRLYSFIRRLSKTEILLLETKLVLWCCLNLLTYFEEKYRSSSGCYTFVSKRRAKYTLDLLHYILDVEMPQNQYEVVTATISYFTFACQWDFEDVVIYVFEKLMLMTTKQDMILIKLIVQIEKSQKENNLNQAHLICRNLSLILENLFPAKRKLSPQLTKCFFTILRIFLLNDIEIRKSTKVQAQTIKFQIQVKNCMKHFISKIKDNAGLVTMMDVIAEIITNPDMPGNEQNDIIDMIHHCAQRLTVKLYKESIAAHLLTFLLSYLKSDYRTSAMSSQRIFQALLDRNNNLQYFITPVYHFKDNSVFTVNYNYKKEDVIFFKNCSQDFFGGIYKCLNRFTEISSLASSYTIICLVLVEVPDPVTTINMIQVVIKTQNNALKNKNFTLVTTFHIHAIVASVLSLICLIHENEVFALAKYVTQVVNYRNTNAPHLMPPLRPDYAIAVHQATTDQNQLYFLEDEVLYALKQCWLGRIRNN